MKTQMRAISAVLWRDWDPIGCGVPEDEYARYVGPLHRLLREAAQREEIAAYLRFTADVTIARPVPEERLVRVLDKLEALAIKPAHKGETT